MSSSGQSGLTGSMSCWPNLSGPKPRLKWTTGTTTEVGIMAHSGKAVVTLPTATQVLITRDFDAPKHLVYRAWTTPDLVKRWWGADRGEVTSVEIDLRVGGAWRY